MTSVAYAPELKHGFPEVAIGKLLELHVEYRRLCREMQSVACGAGIHGFDPHRKSDWLRPLRKKARMQDWDKGDIYEDYALLRRFGLGKDCTVEDLNKAYEARLEAIPHEVLKRWPTVKDRVKADYEEAKQVIWRGPISWEEAYEQSLERGDFYPKIWPSEAATLLGVTQSCTADELDLAYRKKAVELHPDKVGGDGAEFKAVQAAYEKAKAALPGNQETASQETTK